ncbi:MAG TPA: alpha/beta hydrolase [Solirubrobacteraceae bacterium]|jgi:sigma-B regulation protein RsbQ
MDNEQAPERLTLDESPTSDAIRRHHVSLEGAPDGPALVFAHGFGCDQSMWRFVWPSFAGVNRIVLFDHVGMGGADSSGFEPARYATLDGYARDVIEICRELALSDIVYVGHSVSAMIGVLAAIQEPDLFARLVLVCPSPRYIDDADYTGGFSQADIDELLEAMDDNLRAWSENLAPVIMGNPDRPELSRELADSFCRADPVLARHFAHVTFRSDNRRDLERVTTPALVLQCAHDAIAPRAVGDYVRDRLAGSTSVVIEASGHCPNLSAPDATVKAIQGFLAS